MVVTLSREVIASAAKQSVFCWRLLRRSTPAQKQNSSASGVRSWIPGLAVRARNDGRDGFVIPAQAGIQAHTEGCPSLWEGPTVLLLLFLPAR